MRTIVINNQKGGVGKTTIALHLAWYFVEEGRRVSFVDLDAQANASTTLMRDGASSFGANDAGPAASLFDPDCVLRYGDGAFQLLAASSRLNSIDTALAPAIAALRANHARLADAFDVCVIDTPPAFGARNLGALIISDHLLAPIQLEDYALSGVNDLLKSVQVANKLRVKPLNFLGLLPSQFRASSTIHRSNLESLVRDLGRTDLLFPGFLALRQGYAEAVARGVPVWAIRGNSAAAVAGREMRLILGLIADKIGAA